MTIEVPSESTQNKFEIEIPELFPKITHVSVVSYTVLGVPLDSVGRPISTSLNVCFPEIHTTTSLLLGSPRTPAISSSSALSSHFSSESSSGMGGFGMMNSSGGDGDKAAIIPTPRKITDLCINLPLTGVSTQCEYFPERVLHPDFAELNNFKKMRILLLGCDGHPLTITRLFILLRVYGSGSVKDVENDGGKEQGRDEERERERERPGHHSGMVQGDS